MFGFVRNLRKLPFKRFICIKSEEKHVESNLLTNYAKNLQSMLSADEVIRPNINPKDTSVVLFPGQGTQYVGMANRLMRFPEAKRIFEAANEILGYDLLKLCLEGPIEKLNRTEYAQPAVIVSSLAALEQLKEERPKAIDTCVSTAGFSLGELTALIFGGVIPFEKGLQLVQVRANAMQIACDKAAGAMAIVLSAPDTEIRIACEKAQKWCAKNGIENTFCGVGNYMYPHCKVIAGNVEAIAFIEKNFTTLKIKRVKRLSVNGAFHTPLMQSAVEPFTEALSKIILEEPLIRIHSNIDGKPYKNAAHVKKQLPNQIVEAVKWEQTMHEMYKREQGVHFPRTFECGPGTSLIKILGKVNAKAVDSAYNVEA